MTIPSTTARVRLLRLLPQVLLGAVFGAMFGATVSCVSVPADLKSQSQLARAEDQILHRDYAGALDTFAAASNASKTPENAAHALHGMGRCLVELGRYQQAIEALYAARERYSHGTTGSAIERTLGEAFFLNGDYSLAPRHLQKALDKVEGAERDRLLAQLAVCAQRGGDARRARSYVERMENPDAHPEVAELFRTPPPALATRRRPAAARRGSELSRPDSARRGVTGRPRPPVSPLTVIPRQRWRPSPIRRNVSPMGHANRITVHHTGGPQPFLSLSQWETASEIQKIQRVHQKQKGWADIGYHYIVDRAGRVWEGRPQHLQGAHAGGRDNESNLGVVLMGNFIEQHASAGQMASLERFLAYLCRKYRIPPHRVYTHSEIRHGSTECPGPEISEAIARFRQRSVASLTRR